MRATREEREAFGRQLAFALEAAGMSQATLRKRLAERGITKSGTAVSNWVSGAFAPDRRTTGAIDEIVDAGGRLLEALGYATTTVYLDTANLLPADILRWTEMLPPADLDRVVEIIRVTAREASRTTVLTILDTLGIRDQVLAEIDNQHFAVAANEGSADPHEDEVGAATTRHPGGADPSGEPGA
jgi:hypothetical protein